MKKTLLAAGAVLALSTTFSVNAAENDKPEYVSDWWHQSVNVVGSYHTRFGPQIRNDTFIRAASVALRAGSRRHYRAAGRCLSERILRTAR
jgi:nucleoside-specific channel-forming protein